MSNTDKLISAVFYSDIDTVKSIIASDDFDKNVLQDIEISQTPFPLYYLTLCIDVVVVPENFTLYRQAAFDVRNRCNKMLDFWKNYYQISQFEPIEYNRYWDINGFYCYEPTDGVNDIMSEPVSELLKVGNRQIDIELFCAVSKFHFLEVERLLKAGANPNADLFTEEDLKIKDETGLWDVENCIEKIGGECSCLCSQVFDSLVYIPSYNNDLMDNMRNAYELGELVGWAAHEIMYDLLKNNLSNK